MSKAIALANGLSSIVCTDGAQGALCAVEPDRWNWDVGTTQATHTTTNTKVFVEGHPVAVEGDAVIPHPDGEPCVPSPANHSPTTSLCAEKVTIGGKHAVRVESKYNTGTSFDHEVSTGSSKVFIGGPSIAV